MSLENYVQPWSGDAVRHIPKHRNCTDDINDVPDLPNTYQICKYCTIHDIRYAERYGKSNEGRWHCGESTLYLAQDKAVALAEFARHYQMNRSQELAREIRPRQVYRFSVSLNRVLDLRNLEILSELSHLEGSIFSQISDFMDPSVARETARLLRQKHSIQAIFVPSMAFLDNLNRWCLVLFLENLDSNSTAFIPSIKRDGEFKIL